MDSLRGQLELLGLEEALRRADAAGATPSERRRLRDRLETAHDVLTALPMPEELAFLHSGLCQTFLPHARPASDDAIWRRKAGRFTLLVSPGVMDDGRRVARVGVPYGTKARLILIYLQSEGVKGRVVSLGASMSAWIRSLGLSVTGGPRGSIQVQTRALPRPFIASQEGALTTPVCRRERALANELRFRSDFMREPWGRRPPCSPLCAGARPAGPRVFAVQFLRSAEIHNLLF